MKVRGRHRKTSPTGLVVVAAAVTSAAVALVAVPAGATPSTKYYTAAATPTSVDVSSTNPVLVTFTLTNCGSGCAKSSTQSWGSADIVLPASPITGWNWGYDTSQGPATVTGLVVHSSDTSKTGHWAISDVVSDPVAHTQVVELRNDGSNSTDAIAPGEYLTFTASLTPSPAGLAAVTTEVKQSNDFSGTGNDFLHATGNADPTIIIGAPDHLVFGVPPQTVQVTTSSTDTHYMCDEANNGPTVQVVDKQGAVVTWLQGLAVTLSSTPDAGLKYKATSTSTPSSTLQESTINGVATFGSGCTTGLSAATLGGGYVMSASATYAGSPLPMPTPRSFDVLQYVQPCGATTTCDTKTLGSGHTTVDVQGTPNPDFTQATTNRLAASVHVFSQLSTCSGDDGNPNRYIVSVDLANHSKNVLLSWDKTAVQWSVNNGTPFWDVCMWATYAFPTRDGGTATELYDAFGIPTGFYVGVLPDCGASNVGATDPCISSLYRRAGIEYAAVTLPLNMLGDPQFK